MKVPLTLYKISGSGQWRQMIVNITRWTYICDNVETRGNKEEEREEREEWELRTQQMLFVIFRVQA